MDPADIIGTKFIKEIHGHPHKCKVTEALDDTKYLVKVGDGQQEEILTYNEILNQQDQQENTDNNDKTFMFESILDHCRGQGRKYEVLVQCEETWELLRMMIKADPITMATYAANNDLLNEEQWKRLRTYHRQQKYIMKLITRALTGRKRGVHYKFGVQVPNNYNHAVELDKQNKNKEWEASVDTELGKILEYKTQTTTIMQ